MIVEAYSIFSISGLLVEGEVINLVGLIGQLPVANAAKI